MEEEKYFMEYQHDAQNESGHTNICMEDEINVVDGEIETNFALAAIGKDNLVVKVEFHYEVE